MADIYVKVLTPATSTDLVALDTLKINLGLPTGPGASDPQLEQAISMNSATIAVECKRVFARERVEETWYWNGCECLQNPRILLTHAPVALSDIESVTTGGALVDPTDYELEEETGRLRYLLGGWLDPTVITYTGGYVLPDESPLPLQQAAIILSRGAYYAAQVAGVAAGGIKQISHKHARVTYFDPIQQAMMAAGGPMMQQAVKSLITNYTRYTV
jgi:hypothetical protein